MLCFISDIILFQVFYKSEQIYEVNSSSFIYWHIQIYLYAEYSAIEYEIENIYNSWGTWLAQSVEDS